MALDNRKYSNKIYWIGSIAAFGGFLFGFDMAVVSGILPFIQKQLALSPGQLGWFVSSALVGCITGVGLSGVLVDNLGRKKMMVVAAVLFLVSAVGCAFLPNYPLIILARMLSGIGVGVASNIVPLYISEMAPSNIRGRMVTYYQLAVTFGILVAYISNAIIVNLETSPSDANWYHYLFSQEPWRGMFAVGIIPAIIFTAGLFLLPESPRWLLQKQKIDQGMSLMKNLYGQAEAENIFRTFNSIKTEQYDGGSYRTLLNKGVRAMLLLGILLPLFSQFSGINAIIYYGPTILNESGISLENSFTSQLIFGLANMLFTLFAIWKVDKLGRRPLYLIGTLGATFSLLLTGFFLTDTSMNTTVLMLSVLLFLACFAFSIGPLKFVVASEIFPARIRGKAMAMSIMVMWIADAIVGQLTPIMLSSFGARYTFWIFAFFCLIAFVVVYRLLPETKGKSLEVIEQQLKQHEEI
ncbi:sugar porter family MFS transporter [Olivibacter sp. SDN3]|uniref:sugar porter family MFS transporter n=1 Tax=Olivibacter sp. SDN3 TaxID=2764720 RepID=UPI0016519830|nr:sugar porter family MFS transporter [Olivibacter sp. SDN3]QNL48373.1 sugar porter family MFS transporter [Olivibacter sp. SDN3]